MIILGTNSVKAAGGFDVDNSLRFNDGSSDYLSRTPSSAGNTKKFTISFWLKRGTITGADQNIFHAFPGSGSRSQILFNSSEQLLVDLEAGNTNRLITTRVFRDTSAWSNIVIVYDSDNGTSGNRVIIYINGVRETSFGTETYPSSGSTSQINTTTQHEISSYDGSGSYFDGYLAEFVLLDGTVADATSFGEFDEDSGIWKPIKVSGLTFGTNGFYLDFKASGNLGNDANGGTDLTEVNLAATDQSTDTCTNNFATLNPLAGRNNPNAYYATFSEGNLKLVGNSSTNNGNAFSTMGFNSGKWYCEVKMVDADNSLFPIVGVITEAEIVSANSPSNSGQIGTTIAGTVGYSPDGQKIVAGTESSYGNTFTNNDIIGIAIDCDNGAVYFSKNGTFQASGNPTSGSSRTNAAVTFTPSTNYFFGASVYKDTNDIDFNFGSPPFAISSGNTDGNGFGNFEYAVPSGYFSLNTKNLAEYG